MEFMNRGSRPAQSADAAAPAATSSRRGQSLPTPLKWASVALLFAGTILIVALLWAVVLGAPSSEGKNINKDKMQAVFLNGGQVYFGKISDLNTDFLKLREIYYLRVNQQVQPDQEQSTNANDISLVKLGCELHGPEDSMIINREQVVFWENLKDDGQVAKAVAEYIQKNPNGQQCEASQSTSETPATTAPAADEDEGADEDN